MRRLQTFVAIVGIGVLIPSVILLFPGTWRKVHKGFPGKKGNNKYPVELLTGHSLLMSRRRHSPSRPSETDLRSFHMDKYCLKLQKQIHEEKVKISQFQHIIYDDHYKTLYCQIPKVATTNWRRVFLILSGNMNTTNPAKLNANNVHKSYDKYLNYLSDLDPQEIQYRLKNYFKFVIVREPFERLLSAYRNKFGTMSNSSIYFHQRFGRHIIKKFRSNPSQQSAIRGHDVTFSEFVQYILDPERREPLNEHWAEYHSLCLPCIVNYDYIGKYESLTQDSADIIDRMRASNVIEFPPRASTYRHKKTSTVLYEFYQQLSPKTMLKLWKQYYPDFLLFNYTLPISLHNLTNLATYL